MVEATGTERIVTVDLPVGRRGLVSAEQPVEVALPDGTVATAKVRSVGTVVRQPPQGQPDQPRGEATVDVVVALDDPAASGSLDEAPVDARFSREAATDVFAVPVGALLALAEGGYAVERVDPAGGTEMVGVDLGAFADGFVEVVLTTGDLAEGQEVVVPA